MEMDLKVDEYLTGEKHQLGRHVTMLVIMLLTIIVVSTLAVQPTNTAISPHSSFLAPPPPPQGRPGRDSAEILRHQFGISVVEATRQARYMSLAARSKERECICRLVTVLWVFE